MSSLAEFIRLSCPVFMLVVVWVVPVMVDAQFTVQPESVVQVEGLEAVFECLYPGAVVHSWRINGDLPDDNEFPSDFTRIPSSGDTPAMLIIPATPQYNKFVVQCEAILRDTVDRGQSQNATLKVQTQFTVQPVSVVQAEGLEAVFECLYPGAVFQSWRINGDLPANDQFPSDFTRIPSSGDSPAMLIIPATLQYNNFVVQCEAVLQMGGELVTRQSQSATLEVQSIGTPVLQIQITEGTHTVTISWNNPFTSDIIFCVGARSVESNEMIRSVCNVNGTEYNFTSLESGLCEDISFTVTPTEGGRSGTSERVVGYISGTRGVLRTSTPCNRTRILETHCELLFTTPLSCDIELTFISNDAEELLQINHTITISGNGGTTYELDSTIEVNRHYSVGLTVITSSGRHALPSQIVSTHDIIEGRAEPSITEGALRTTCTFVQDTMASGYLVTIYRDSCSIHDDIVFSVEYNTAGTGDTISGVGSGRYITAFFDLESDGLPIYSRDNHTLIASASLVGVHITTGTRIRNNIESAHPLEKASIELNGDTVCVYCSSDVDCLVLLYDCTTPDILITLFVPVSEERCSDIQDGRYSVAFYRIDSSSGFLLDGFPGRVFQDFNLGVPTTNPVTTGDSLTSVPTSPSATPTTASSNVSTTTASTSVFSVSLLLMLSLAYLSYSAC